MLRKQRQKGISMHRFTKPVVSLGIVVVLLAIALGTTLFATPRLRPTRAASAQTYIVLYKAQAVPADAANTILQAGGTLVYSYPQIGVVIASSDNTAFRDNLMTDSQIDSASATTNYGSKIDDGTVNGESSTDGHGPPPGDLPNAPASDSDNLSPLQWDMRQIHAPEAHQITGGSPSVVVGDIDTGLDFTHPDLAQNVDFADSVSCLGGVPNTNPSAWKDDNGHGTHTAGIIAATNNSYFADPFLFNCRNDPVQRAIWKAERRAIQFAQQQGVTVVAAAGNESDDLSHPQVDNTSPDNVPAPTPRDVTNGCVVIPVEITGVIGVSADGNDLQTPSGYLKSFYSNFGVSAVEVVAPGGDSIFGKTAQAFNGRVLSTWPSYLFTSCPVARQVVDASVSPPATYCYLQGTSMASPHVAGVAALIISQFGKMMPGAVQAKIIQSADSQPCPDTLPAGYASFTRPSGSPQLCQGGVGQNSWYGKGQVNALNAIS